MATQLALFSLIWLSQIMTPGPNFVRISHTALTGSRGAAMTTAFGTAMANCTWCIAAAAGAALLMGNQEIRFALHLFGAIYFAVFGTKLVRAAVRGRAVPVAGVTPIVSGARAFRAGYTTAIMNPQSIVFFATIFLTMFPHLTAGVIGAVLLIVAGVTLGWYVVVTTVLTAPPARRIYDRLRPAIDLLFGALLWLAALRLLQG